MINYFLFMDKPQSLFLHFCVCLSLPLLPHFLTFPYFRLSIVLKLFVLYHVKWLKRLSRLIYTSSSSTFFTVMSKLMSIFPSLSLHLLQTLLLELH